MHPIGREEINNKPMGLMQSACLVLITHELYKVMRNAHRHYLSFYGNMGIRFWASDKQSQLLSPPEN
jgi:hypothetical protein